MTISLFVITIVFTILSFKSERWLMFSTWYLMLIEEKHKINRGMLVKIIINALGNIKGVL